MIVPCLHVIRTVNFSGKTGKIEGSKDSIFKSGDVFETKSTGVNQTGSDSPNLEKIHRPFLMTVTSAERINILIMIGCITGFFSGLRRARYICKLGQETLI